MVDLSQRIKCHLFVVSPNNSGSTLLHRLIAQSAEVWSLPREGQHMVGFRGPSSRSEGLPLVWAARTEWLARFTAPGVYDWEHNRNLWYFLATSKRRTASVFLEKSPPFLLNVEALARGFPGARFVILVRNPYAVVESIVRRSRRRESIASHGDLRLLAAQHVVECLRWQVRNRDKLSDCALLLKYEELCADPPGAARRVQALVPVLNDLDFEQTVSVKQIYHGPVADQNPRQLARLTEEDLRMINTVFEPEAPLLGKFGYDLLTRSA